MSYNFTASQEEEMLNLIQRRLNEQINTLEWAMLRDLYAQINEAVPARNENLRCWMLMITPTGDYVDHLGSPEEAIQYVKLRKSALGDNPEGIQLYAVQELPLTPQSEPKTGGTRDFQEKTDE